MTTNIEIVRAIYTAFEGGDMDRVFSLFADDIHWIEPKGYWVSPGGVHGKPAIAETLAAYPQRWSEMALEPQTYIDAGDHVVVLGRQSGVAAETGRGFDGRFANVWLLRDGLAQTMEAFSDTGLMWKALGGQPGD